MITYVINTSENKTFESDMLFDVAGYNKIRWINCRLDEIEKSADEIYDKQNVLAAEDFRVAVIVDFYGFDKIRAPYGRDGFGEETGVDLSLYMPYIEMYLTDKLINALEKREMIAEDYEVFYVQSAKYERYEHLANAKKQLKFILKGVGDITPVKRIVEVPVKKKKKKDSDAADDQSVAEVDEEDFDEEDYNEEDFDEEDYSKKNIKTKKIEITEDGFQEFELHCSESISLRFKLEDYPYSDGKSPLSFTGFFDAFNTRIGTRKKIRPHYYVTAYGVGAVRAAFDTLSLSLYIIRIYEREEGFKDDGELEVPHIDGNVLRDVLETSWMKLAVAKEFAAEHDSKYYALEQSSDIQNSIKRQDQLSAEDALEHEKAMILTNKENFKTSVDSMYWHVIDCASKDCTAIEDENREEFDKTFGAYLKKRDLTNERSVEMDFENLREIGALETTDQCPTRSKYEYAVESRQKDISDLFNRALAAEYIAMEYEEERKAAENAYHEYCKWRACLHRNLIGDVIFMVLIVLFAIHPYKMLQLEGILKLTVGKDVLFWITVLVLAGVFTLSFVINLCIMAKKMNAERKKIEDCYASCLAKRKYAFSELRRRYEHDLIRIEEARYEIRQITHLFELNLAKERCVSYHRKMLELVQDRVSSMLNNLGVEPVYDPEQSIFDEFTLEKPAYAKENRVYQVFSIETIERLFPRKKRGED